MAQDVFLFQTIAFMPNLIGYFILRRINVRPTESDAVSAVAAIREEVQRLQDTKTFFGKAGCSRNDYNKRVAH